MIELTDSDRAAINDAFHGRDGGLIAVYRAGIEAGLERAAQLLENDDWRWGSNDLPKAIRALKGWAS